MAKYSAEELYDLYNEAINAAFATLRENIDLLKNQEHYTIDPHTKVCLDFCNAIRDSKFINIDSSEETEIPVYYFLVKRKLQSITGELLTDMDHYGISNDCLITFTDSIIDKFLHLNSVRKDFNFCKDKCQDFLAIQKALASTGSSGLAKYAVIYTIAMSAFRFLGDILINTHYYLEPLVYRDPLCDEECDASNDFYCDKDYLDDEDGIFS